MKFQSLVRLWRAKALKVDLKRFKLNFVQKICRLALGSVKKLIVRMVVKKNKFNRSLCHQTEFHTSYAFMKIL